MAPAADLSFGASDSCCEDVGSPTACDQGTLFRWWTAPEVAGGPDLSEPITTDRPDFTEASVTVGRGVFQVESGYTFGQDDDADVRVRSHSIGELLFRYGVLADWFELRLGVSPVAESVRDPAGSVSASGVEDLYLGTKLALTPQAGFLPEMALVPQMTVPTGSNPFGSEEVLPGVNWLYGWDINDSLSTAGSTQVNRALDADGSYAEWAQSWTVGYGLTDRVAAYTEWFAFFPYAATEANTEHYFNGGFTVLLTDDVQWDIRSGVGLNEAAEDFFCGTGLSLRFR
jgi:hypothetical protein